MSQDKRIFGGKSFFKRIGESYTRDKFVPLNISVSERVAEINERCKSNNEDNQKKKLNKTPHIPPFVGASYVGTRNIMDGKHPYLQALKEQKKKESSTGDKAAAIAAKKEFFDRLSQPIVRTAKPERERPVKPPAANSNRSDQRFEGTPNKSEVTPSTQNRFGYKKPVPSPRISRTKNVPKETTGDKNILAPVLHQRERSVSQSRKIPRTSRSSSRNRHMTNPLDGGRKQSLESKSRIPLSHQQSTKSNNPKECSSQPEKYHPKSAISPSKQTKSSSKTKTNSGTVDTKSDSPYTVKTNNRSSSPKRLSKSKSNSSRKMDQDKCSETKGQIFPAESVCDSNHYFSNDYQERDASKADLVNCNLDRVEEKMISYRTQLNMTPTGFGGYTNFFIKPIQLNVTHEAIENETLKTTPNSEDNILPTKTNCQNELGSGNQKNHSDLIGTNEDKVGNSNSELKHKQYPTQNSHNTSRELKDYNQAEDRVLRVKDPNEIVADIRNDTPCNDSYSNLDIEEKIIPLNSRKVANSFTADQAPKNNHKNDVNGDESRMINRKNIPDNNGIFDQNVSNSKLTDQPNETILKDEGTYGSISSKDDTNTQTRLNNAPLISLENFEDNQKEQSDEDSSENPKENKNFFKNIRNKVSSVFAKDSDNEDSSSEMDVSLDDRRRNVSDHSEEETPADQQEALHKNSSENSNESRTPLKNFRKKVRPASTKDTDNDVNFNETDATLDDTQMRNVPDHSNEEMPTDQQENSDIDSPRSPKEKKKPFKNLRNKVRSVFAKDSDNEDSSNEMDATPDARKGNVSDDSEEETPTDYQGDVEKNSPENPSGNRKPFKNFREKVRSAFTKDSDNEDSSNEMDSTLDNTTTGNVSDQTDEETSRDQHEYSDINSPGGPKEKRKPFKNLRNKVRSVFAKGSDNEDSSKEIDATVDDSTTGNLSDHSDEETPSDQYEHSDKNSPEYSNEKKPSKSFRHKIRSVFARGSDNEDSSKEIDATVDDSTTGNLSDNSDEETHSDQYEHSDKNSPENSNEKKPSKSFRHKIRSVFARGSDNEDSSKEIDATVDDSTTGNLSDHSNEETPSDQYEHSDKNSPENSNEKKPSKSFRHKIRNVFARGSDNEDSSKEIDTTVDDSTTGNLSDHSNEETPSDQYEHSDKNSPENSNEKKPSKSFRHKIRNVFARGSDNEDSSKEIDTTVDDSTTGNLSDHSNEETPSDQYEHSDKNSPENSNEKKPSKSFRHKIRNVFARGSDNEDSSKEIDTKVDDSTTGNLSDYSDEEMPSDQYEHFDKNSPENSNEKKPSKSFRHKIRSVFARGSDNEDSSKEIDATVDDSTTGNLSDHSDEETPSDQYEQSDKNSPENSNEKKPSKSFRHKIRSVFARGSDNEDSSKEIDATVDDSTTGNLSDHSDEETPSDQYEHSDKNSPENSNEKKPSKSFRHKIRSVFARGSDNEDSSKEIDSVLDDTQMGNISDHSDEETPTDQQENSDINSPRSPKEKRKPFKNFRNKVRSVFAKDSDNEDSSNEIDATSGDTVDVSDHSDEETFTDQEQLDKTFPESPNENRTFKNFRNKFRSVFTKDSTNEDTSSEIDNTPEKTTSNVSGANDQETSERNGKSDKNKAVDARVFDRHFNDPDKSITIEASNDTQNLNAALHSVNRGTLKSNKDIVGVTKEKSGNNTKDASFRTKNGKTVEATENFQPSSKVALVDSTLPVDQYMADAAEVQKCPPLYAKPNIKGTIVEPSTEQYPENLSENEEFQSESNSPENNKRDKYNNDSIVDLLDKLDTDQQKASDEESTSSKSNPTSPEKESAKSSSPSRSTSFSRFRSKLSSMFSFKSDKMKNNAKEKSVEKEEASDVRKGDENDGDGTADRKDGDDSGSIFDKSEAPDGDDTTIRRDVLKPVKIISTHSPNINSNKKIERRQSDKTLSEDSEEELPKEERSHDHEDIITGECEDNEYNPFDKFYYTNEGKHLTELAPANSNANDSSSGIQGIDEDKNHSDGKKTSNLNSTSSSPSSFYKTPPPDIPSINIQEDSTIYQKPNIYNESEDNDSLFESSSLYTSSQLSESEFPPEQKDTAESTTPPMSSEADNKENTVKKSIPWYNKFRALFSLKKTEKTPDENTTTDDGEFSRAESYHPKMLDTDVVDLDTVSNSPNWSDIIDDDVVSEDVERKLAAQNSKLIFKNDSDSFVQTKPKLNSTENVSRSTSFPDTENQRTSSKLPIKGQSLDQDNTLQEGNSLKRWPPLDENTNVADNPMSQQKYPLSSERSTSNEDLSDDSLETEQKIQANIDRKPLTQSSTLNAETSLDSTNAPKNVVVSKKSSKVPIRVKKANFSDNKKTVLSPTQSRLFDDPHNVDTIKDPSKGRHLRKDGNDRTSTVSGNESNIMIKKRAKEPITLETSNAHLVRRNGRSPTETRDRRDVKKQAESKYKPIGNQAADGRRVLPKGGNKTKTTSYADSLDENLLTEIFSFLEQKTLIFIIPLVCKKWKRASCHPSLWQLVDFSYGRMTTNFLEKFSQRFTNLRELCFDNIQGRPKRRGESEKFYQQEIRGSLEKGLETVLISAEGSLQKLTITNCGSIFTERSLWLVSCYARLLEEFTYHSALHPPTAEVLWALVSGCRDITKLDLSPINPRSPQQERFSNKCTNLIAKGYPGLKSISIGGCGIDNQGLLIIAQQCQALEELELNQFMADFNESSAKKLCKRGLHNLECLKFTHTPVQSETIQVFMKNCPNLKKINVQVKMQDYFSNSEDSKFKQQYRFILIKLKSLKANPKLDQILELDIRDNK